MAKVLLTHKNLEEHICRETGSLYADKGMIIPPGMKDYLQTIGISIRYEQKPTDKPKASEQTAALTERTAEPAVTGDLAVLTRRIVAILQDEYQVNDEQTLRQLCLRVVKEVDQGTDRNR